MVPLLGDLKHVQSVPPIAVGDNNAASAVAIDTYGYEYLRVTVDFGAVGSPVSTLKLQESDLSNMSGATDISGTVVGTDNNDTGVASTLPGATNNSNTAIQFCVNLKGHKRYVKPVMQNGTVNAGTGCVVSITGELARAHEEPRTATLANVSQRMVV